MISELALAGSLLSSKFPTAIQQVNYPYHKGKPNPFHGKFYFVGSIPASCYDTEKQHSHYFDTEEQAIQAAIAGGAQRIQRVDCSFVRGVR